jgi:NAD(P)-dependent dehydrogenase (short-subunit alcohol dehydrogenase family)
VLLAGRSPSRLETAVAGVQAVASGPAPEAVVLDLADLSSVRAAAADIAARAGAVDVLMNNAGVMAVPEARTVDGFELQLATNHLGHVALTGLLLPALLAAPAARVVTTSSVAHRMGRIREDDLQWERRPYSRWGAYGQSKLANLLFVFELQRRLAVADSPVRAIAAHPGWAATELQQRTGNAIMNAAAALANRVIAQGGEQGAWPTLYAATQDLPGGAYVGPDGRAELRGHPTLVSPSSAATDGGTARSLWELSERLTGVTYRAPGSTRTPRPAMP